MKKTLCFLLLLLNTVVFTAQETETDSILPVYLDDVILIGKKSSLRENQKKPLASLDEYLEQSGKINMLTRGGYAWEPLLNSMSTERSVITIDGMHIFSACTDKMDPVTSYVEISNLSEAEVSSGQSGSMTGATIGGSINLKRNRSGFTDKGFRGHLQSGYDTNGNRRILGADVAHATKTFFADANVMYRDAENYDAGGGAAVNYSQFEKINISVSSGVAFASNKQLEASMIYDKASNVGYPALPMDVSSAEAYIGSLKFEINPATAWLHDWETKVYFNGVTHVMDDSKRPDVPIRMDMPGWSTTYGMYSKLEGSFQKHQFQANLNAYYNKSLAEMTMYAENETEEPMFMFTWGDIRTLYSGISLKDHWYFDINSALEFTLSAGRHFNEIAEDEGFESLAIFYPDMDREKSRFLGSVAVNYVIEKNDFQAGSGLAYGQRAPSVSEGYGFYIFNSFDTFDYIGNPHLKNEGALEANAFLRFKKGVFSTKFSISYFRILNYIVGKPDNSLSAMTIGAAGVKKYTSLDYADIFNADWEVTWNISRQLAWKTLLTYARGTDNNDENLPFMSPLNYRSSLSFQKEHFSTEVAVNGSAAQTYFSSFYGEDRTPAYAVVDWSGKYHFDLAENSLTAVVGVENIFDTYYSTFSDWNNIPRRGRNIFVQLQFTL